MRELVQRSAGRTGPAALLVFTAVLCAASPALAWKPITHVYLAEEAREEMVSSGGYVSTHEVDFWGRQVLGSTGSHPVSSSVYQALRDYPAYYRAGVLGPDAYPDLLFGQQVIHPDTNNEKGTESWLQHLEPLVKTQPQRAFYLGFLAHAAGDMFGHTFVNHYSGGPFTLSPLDNAFRHIAVEGYVGNHTPELRGSGSYTIDTALVNDFIYQTMIDADRPRDGNINPNPSLPAEQQVRLRIWQLTRSTAHKTLPGLFTRLRAGLQDKTAAYYSHVNWLRQQHRVHSGKCGFFSPLECAKAAYYRVLLAGYQTIAGLPVQYMEAWVRDISRGLKAWPSTSTTLARVLFMNQNRQMDLSAAKSALTQYRDTHLCPMLGAPDAACTFLISASNLISEITAHLPFITALKEKIFETIVKALTGMTPEEWKQKFEAGETDVDKDVPATPSTSSELNGLMAVTGSPPRFNATAFAPAYNTMTAIKLSFFDTRAQWKEVLGAVGWTPPSETAEAMMQSFNFSGQVLRPYIRDLDHDNQLYRPARMFLVNDCGVLARFFMQQTGDDWEDPVQGPLLAAACPELASLVPRSPQLQCGGFEVQAGLTRSTGPMGGVLKLEGRFKATPVPGMPRHVYLPPGASSATVRFTQGLENQSAGLVVFGTRVAQSSQATSTQVSTCATGEVCSANVCVSNLPVSLTYSYAASATSNATAGTFNLDLSLSAGQTVQLSTCGQTGASYAGDTYLRLHDGAGSLVAYNDDACGGWGSSISFTASASGTYQLRAGCYSANTCAGRLVVTTLGTPPRVTGGSFPYSATNTSSATVNTVDRGISLLAGQLLTLGTCGITGATVSGDTYLRLFSEGGTQVTANDQACGSNASRLLYTVPAGASGEYQVRSGCYLNGTCGGTVAFTISG